ncbi:MAG: SGNH/GDSL hydrolase family protein [Deltaproteobacteria bacterium]|nr:SGNH/GDSL hydrolase family protein [Deltaproteobacteria bacterium]
MLATFITLCAACGDPASTTEGSSGDDGSEAAGSSSVGSTAASATGVTTTAGGDGSTGTGADDGSSGAASNGSSDDGSSDASSSGGVIDDAPLELVVIGASTAAGKNLDQPQYGGAPGNKPFATLYAEQLAIDRPGSTVVNLAVPGTTSFDGMPTGSQNPPGYAAPDPMHNITAALAESPDMVLVAYHLGAGASTEQVIANLTAIQDAADAAGVPVWFSTPLPRFATADPAQLAQIPEMRDAVLTTFGDHALDFFAALVGDDGYADATLFLTDENHPNQAGHQALYQVLLDADLPAAL